MGTIADLFSQILLKAIGIYRWLISPLLGRCCRFYPSCSSYALAAIEKHGAMVGSRLTIVRVLKCHPWHPGGVDEIP